MIKSPFCEGSDKNPLGMSWMLLTSPLIKHPGAFLYYFSAFPFGFKKLVSISPLPYSACITFYIFSTSSPYGVLCLAAKKAAQNKKAGHTEAYSLGSPAILYQDPQLSAQSSRSVWLYRSLIVQ
jgi:hypothetical protein